ncbi:MAG: hypothetical protein LBT09_04510 [Planctomycetaceae bacterium]|nr:hypothetical protein [Planctomycetaceae bacterium]
MSITSVQIADLKPEINLSILSTNFHGIFTKNFRDHSRIKLRELPKTSTEFFREVFEDRYILNDNKLVSCEIVEREKNTPRHFS